MMVEETAPVIVTVKMRLQHMKVIMTRTLLPVPLTKTLSSLMAGT